MNQSLYVNRILEVIVLSDIIGIFVSEAEN